MALTLRCHAGALTMGGNWLICEMQAFWKYVCECKPSVVNSRRKPFTVKIQIGGSPLIFVNELMSTPALPSPTPNLRERHKSLLQKEEIGWSEHL
jgi:hypothetical protein